MKIIIFSFLILILFNFKHTNSTIAHDTNCCDGCFSNSTATVDDDDDADVDHGLFDYKTDLVRNQYIVKFSNYFDKAARRDFIASTLAHLNFTNFILFNHTYDDYPSDFDLIQFNNAQDEFELVDGIGRHPYVKSVTPQRRVTRALKSVKKSQDNETQKPQKSHKKRNLKRAAVQQKQIIDALDARHMWKMGHTGENVNVAVFDTGLEDSHVHFKRVMEKTDWTNEKDSNDNIGHGTFVAGVIASSKECLGLAPDANLFIFKVFTHNQVSYTTWFLEAFNHALRRHIDVLNLSIGGPDFMDQPFVEKVWELTSSNIIMVSAIGNDGPLYGTLNNPADQMDVIGVGGINFDNQIARFSSRGMTTWELPHGYGRLKPDLVTYGTNVRGSQRKSGCRTLSGTSVASPVVTGAIALLLSAFKHRNYVNPASIKQALMLSADRLPQSNMFEQGHGKLNLLKAYELLSTYTPQVTLSPSYIDLTECPYMWPYCTQPLYHTQMPLIINVTIINGLAVKGTITSKPEWQPFTLENGNCLDVSINYSDNLWPWSGYLAVFLTVNESCKAFNGIVHGQVVFKVQEGYMKPSIVNLPIKARIIPTPPRAQRLLWDQFHNLRYPPGYFPRDNLRMKNDPLDWNADHVHTNFKDMYEYLKGAGYYVEVLGHSYNCFNASNYGALLIVDTEDEFDETEIRKLYSDVYSAGLSLIVFADWYNTSVIKEAKFFDENTQQWWIPDTGGANVPALNNLLQPYDIQFGDFVYEGEYEIGEHTSMYTSGTSLTRFPKSSQSYVIYRNMNDQGVDFLKNKQIQIENVPILGLHQVQFNESERMAYNPGRIVAYGDSNCLDSSHMQKDCYWLLSALLEYTCHSIMPNSLKEKTSEDFIDNSANRIERMTNTNFHKYTKINSDRMKCMELQYEVPKPINDSAPTDLYKHQRLLSSIHLVDDSPQFNGNKKRVKYKDVNIDYDQEQQDQSQQLYIFQALFDDNYPIITYVAILLVISFFMYKFYKFHSRPRIKRSLAYNNKISAASSLQQQSSNRKRFI